MSDLRAAVLTAALVVLLAGPTALAFFSGGYFDEPRAWAGLGAWFLVVGGLLAEPRALPQRREAWLALGGLGLFAAWSLLSITWSPIKGDAYHSGQIAVLYVGGLLAAAVLLRSRAALRALEPALAAGALVVIGYALSDRLFPGLLHFQGSSEGSLLQQPLTYWNALGELAALGLVLCARLAGDASRALKLRAVAAAATAPLGMGLYLSGSRGALYAWAAGLVTLVVAAPRREQLRAIAVSALTAGVAALISSRFSGVQALSGSLATREGQGIAVLVLMVVIMAVAGLAQWWFGRRERVAELRLPRGAPLLALGLVCGGFAAAIVFGGSGQGTILSGGHYFSAQSDRYAYWRVAIRAFSDEPLRGVGAGNWSVYWLRYRSIRAYTANPHSLELQTLAELGLVGLALLAVFLAGIALAARDAYRAAPIMAAGPIAGMVVYIAHSPLDWDWQMPAVTLVAVALAGAVLALAEGRGSESLSQCPA